MNERAGENLREGGGTRDRPASGDAWYGSVRGTQASALFRECPVSRGDSGCRKQVRAATFSWECLGNVTADLYISLPHLPLALRFPHPSAALVPDTQIDKPRASEGFISSSGEGVCPTLFCKKKILHAPAPDKDPPSLLWRQRYATLWHLCCLNCWRRSFTFTRPPIGFSLNSIFTDSLLLLKYFFCGSASGLRVCPVHCRGTRQVCCTA